MSTYKKGLMVIVSLIAVTSAALAFIGPDSGPATAVAGVDRVADGLVTMATKMVQGKVLQHSDGKVSVAVTLTAGQLPREQDQPKKPVDLVIVVDRSGSMTGQKIEAARQAVHRLIERLTVSDRLALVTYSNGVEVVAPLTTVDAEGSHRLAAAVDRIYSSGGTNLGGGLKRGIDMFLKTQDGERQRKVILISDGLANQGVTDPGALGQMAATATDYRFAVSTVGVGLDFNELLMTTIADHGMGSYYFLENPQVFAQVFEKEFQQARQVAAASLALRVPLEKGVQLVDAGGYPISIKDGYAVVHPGQLIAGQERKFFLTFKVPTDKQQDLSLGHIALSYQHKGNERTLENKGDLVVACVTDQKQVLSSVDEEEWSGQVLQDAYNKLKDEVATAVRKGDAQAAEASIQAYETEQRSMNSTVGSVKVAEHLESDIQELKKSVADTFSGPPAAVALKQKKNAKVMQYESYQKRRGKN